MTETVASCRRCGPRCRRHCRWCRPEVGWRPRTGIVGEVEQTGPARPGPCGARRQGNERESVAGRRCCCVSASATKRHVTWEYITISSMLHRFKVHKSKVRLKIIKPMQGHWMLWDLMAKCSLQCLSKMAFVWFL